MSGATLPLSMAEKLKAFRQLLDSLIQVITESGEEGVPGGTLYSALMHQGCTLPRFEKCMGILVESGRIVQSGHLYKAARSSLTTSPAGSGIDQHHT